MKIYLNMPVGDCYGWAICGKNLLKELAKISEVKYIPENFPIALRDAETAELVKKYQTNLFGDIPYPLIHTVTNFMPSIKYNGRPNMGYMFYEDHKISKKYVELMNNTFDVVVGGSTWNKKVLDDSGVKHTASIVQGVDRTIFYPKKKEEYKDNFVIFSSGKYEHRKSQDIVVDAISYLQQRYKDVMLIASWSNIFEPDKYKAAMKENIEKLDKKRVVFMPLLPQKNMPDIMRNTDIGVFPNRCEGGTNMVLMEYLACGRPVAANNSTGQKDVLNNDYTYFIDDKRLLDSTISELEYAYFHRHELDVMGKLADSRMNNFSWERTAKQFYKLCESNI